MKRKITKSYLAGEASYGILAEENGLGDKSGVKEFVKWYRRKLSKEPEFEVRSETSKSSIILSTKELETKVSELEKRLKYAELKA